MKKYLKFGAIVLVLVMVIGCFAACGSKTDGDNMENPDGTEAPAVELNELTLTNDTDATVTLQYPDAFTYTEEDQDNSFLHQEIHKKCGALKAADYYMAFAFGEINTSVYEDVYDYFNQFEWDALYEETKINGADAYVRQKGQTAITMVMPTSQTKFFMVEIKNNDGVGNEEGYAALYASEDVKAVLQSIKLSTETVENEAVKTPQGYVTITPCDGWVKGEGAPNDAIVLENATLGTVVTITISDTQLISDMEQSKSITSSGYDVKEFKELKIGANTYQHLAVNDTLNYLLIATSTGKIADIEVRNCTLEDAQSVLETIVIG